MQTADGTPQSEKLRHYIAPATGGATKALDVPPEWAEPFWAFKSDRAAPGIGSLMIDVEQKFEKVKIGTGSGRPDEASGGAGNSSSVDIEKTAEGQRAERRAPDLRRRGDQRVRQHAAGAGADVQLGTRIERRDSRTPIGMAG